MREDDADYCRRRALEEQIAAQRANCEVVRDRHDELAMMYRFRAFMLTTHPGCWSDAFQQQVELA